jgi:type I restriction enzyme S subunit
VRFLGWASGRLERAIRSKRKVIVLLNEQKQAIIHRAVTRGLDPSVPLKPSGIPWLGDIPHHWKVERTKNVFRLRTQKSGLAHGKELLSIYTHIGVRPRKDLEQKGNKASTTDDYWVVQKGDLIVNKLLAWMGAVGSSDYEGVTSPAYDILMPIRPLCSDYYHHLFRTNLYLGLFKQRSRGIMDMRLRLYFDQLGQIPVPFPPVDEQFAIVAFYLEATADLTAAISRLEREIKLLREYRTRLVADVVTGKLDVREAATRLPEKTAPDITEDETELSIDPEATDEEAVA